MFTAFSHDQRKVRFQPGYGSPAAPDPDAASRDGGSRLPAALPFPWMAHRLPRNLITGFLAAAIVVASFALIAPEAFAGDGGVGTAGRITDKYITFFCFGVIAFFAIFVTVMSLIQGRLDARKEQRRHDLDRFNT